MKYMIEIIIIGYVENKGKYKDVIKSLQHK